MNIRLEGLWKNRVVLSAEKMKTEESETTKRVIELQNLTAAYDISKVIISVENTEKALDEIISIARPAFIFDNVVFYKSGERGALDVVHARAIGRGRFREADLEWGESIAQEVCSSGQLVIKVEDITDQINDRTGLRHYLGLPLYFNQQIIGALIFIRFGGPAYLPDQIQFAEFLANNVSQVFIRNKISQQLEALRAKQRLDSLQDDFVAMISHELLTPLGFIKGYATTLLREDTTWDDQDRREFLMIIDEESDRLRELIDNIMDSSRLQAGTLQMNYQPVRILTLLKDAATRAKSRDENMQIRMENKVGNLQITVDPTRLSQVIDNILANASKYAPNSPILITTERIDGFIQITIADRGPGIDPAHLEKIFHRFYRVPNHSSTSVRGSGLGLYICRKIIEEHQGKIIAESKLGVGTKFIIQLPIKREKKLEA